MEWIGINKSSNIYERFRWKTMLTSPEHIKRPKQCRDTVALDGKIQYYKNVGSVPIN